MASIISAGTTDSTSLNVSGDKSGILQLASNNAVTAVTIDTSQNVGIGTSSPTQKLQVAGSQLLASPGNSVYTYFDGTPTYVGREATAGSLVFGVNSSERMRINSSGYVGIGTTSPSAPLNVQAIATNGLAMRVNGRSADNYGELSFWNNANSTNYATVGADQAAMYFGTNASLPVTFTTGSTERMRIASSGRILAGTAASFGNDGLLHVDSTTIALNGINVKCAAANFAYIAYTSTNFMYFTISGAGSNGTITWNGSITVYGTASDRRLKENIVDAPSAFDFINSLKIRSFDWKESGKHHKFGVIAQELVEVSPESVSVPQKEEDIWQVDTSALVPSLVKAIQELKAINDTQAETINALTARIVALEAK
jgi:hypothetical protein